MKLKFLGGIPNEEELRQIVDSFFIPEKKRNKDEFQVNEVKKRKLARYGSSAVTPILDVSERRRKEGTLRDNPHGLPLSLLLTIVAHRATRDHAERLANMLVWDEFTETESILFKYVRHSLFLALHRVGDEGLVHYVEEHVQIVEQKYLGQGAYAEATERHYDAKMIHETIEAMRQGGLPNT